MRIYVASPYQIPQEHFDEVTRGVSASSIHVFTEHRVRAARFATAMLQAHAYHKKLDTWFYTPIGYEHTIVNYQPLDNMRMDHDYWLKMDLKILESMQGLVVLAIPGWTLSAGIRKEVEFMREFVGARMLVHVVGDIRSVDPGVADPGVITISQRLRMLDKQTDIRHYRDLGASMRYVDTVSRLHE